MTGALCAAALAAACGSDPKGQGDECFGSSECGPGLVCDFAQDPPVCAPEGTGQPTPDAEPAPVVDAAPGPDAPPAPDAAPGTPDAAPEPPDASPPDASPPDASPPDAAPVP